MLQYILLTKGQIISKGLLVSSNSPKKQTNKFVFTTTTNSFVHFLGEFKDTKKSFRNYLTFSALQNASQETKNSFCFGCRLIPRKAKLERTHFSKVQSSKTTVCAAFAAALFL